MYSIVDYGNSYVTNRTSAPNDSACLEFIDLSYRQAMELDEFISSICSENICV